MINESTNGRRYVVFNHDGFGLLAELAGTDCTPADADRVRKDFRDDTFEAYLLALDIASRRTREFPRTGAMWYSRRTAPATAMSTGCRWWHSIPCRRQTRGPCNDEGLTLGD